MQPLSISDRFSYTYLEFEAVENPIVVFILFSIGIEGKHFVSLLENFVGK